MISLPLYTGARIFEWPWPSCVVKPESLLLFWSRIWMTWTETKGCFNMTNVFNLSWGPDAGFAFSFYAPTFSFSLFPLVRFPVASMRFFVFPNLLPKNNLLKVHILFPWHLCSLFGCWSHDFTKRILFTISLTQKLDDCPCIMAIAKPSIVSSIIVLQNLSSLFYCNRFKALKQCASSELGKCNLICVPSFILTVP